MSRWSDLQLRGNDLLAKLQKPLKFRKPLTTNSNMQLLWLATVTTRLTKWVQSDGICVRRLAALSKVKQVRPSQWSSISDLNMTSKLWVWTNLFLKSSKRDKIFTYRPSFACLLESRKKFVKTRKLWPLWDKVSFKSLTIASDQSVNSTRWSQRAKRSSNGVSTLPCNPTRSKPKSSNDQKYSNLQTLPPKLPEEISTQASKIRIKWLMEASPAYWTIRTI